MCTEVFQSLGDMIGLVENCAQMIGKLARVSEMLEVLDELDEKHEQPSGREADAQWSWSGSELSSVGSGLNVLGAYGDSAKQMQQTQFDGKVSTSLRSLGVWLGSQAAPDSVAAYGCGARFGTPCYVTAGKWWRRLEQRDGDDSGGGEKIMCSEPSGDVCKSGTKPCIQLRDLDIVTPVSGLLFTFMFIIMYSHSL
jgi:hypothetical protein